MGDEDWEVLLEIIASCGLSRHELARTIHPHPTLSEAIHEAALAALDGAIHA